MPVSAKRFSEIRLMVSDLLQRGDWARLFENSGSSDPELAKAISGIFSMYDHSPVWKFVSYVQKLPREIRRERRDSTAVVCYILGRMGHDNTEKALSVLRTFLVDDHMLRSPVDASLSNLWVLDKSRTERSLFHNWVLKGGGNDDLQEISVRSSEYLLSKDSNQVAPFLLRVGKLEAQKFQAARNTARELISNYSLKNQRSRGKKRKRNTKKGRKTKRVKSRKLFSGLAF